MKTAISVKRCPACGMASVLEAAECWECRHHFRTRFVDAPVRTEPAPMLILPSAAKHPGRPTARRLAFQPFGLKYFVLSVLLVGLTWLCWNGGQMPVGQPAAEAASLPPPAKAERLYRDLRVAMSLYDVDQVAGGTGRVVSVPDSHTLLLSYDYSNQSVQVLLDRIDDAGSDYQVQAVALYQGKTLLQRHADVE